MNNGLNIYQPSSLKPWNESRVIHLYRRLGMGPTPAEIKAGVSMGPAQLVDQLIDRVVNDPTPPRPYWADFTDDDFSSNEEYYQALDEMRHNWYQEMLQDGVRARLVLFWHNHFVTEFDVYGCPKYLWNYFEVLHQNSLGNFKDFVKAIGLTPAMLVYLNGNINRVGRPNENYARELMELFTMGESNGYTQIDVAEMARALTGYRANQYRCETPWFDNNRFDKTPKTIFGKTGNWGYDDVHDLIFTERANEVAHHICQKIYKYFVYEKADASIVNQLAETFKASGWELSAVFRQLFKSEHFFEEKFISTQISSPLDTLIKWSRATTLTPEDIGDRRWVFRWGPYDMGMDIFNPVNVAGWPGYHAWMNENTYTLRIRFLRNLSDSYWAEPVRQKLHQWVVDIAPSTTDPVGITARICEQVLGKVPEPEILNGAVSAFKGDIPEHYYEENSWNLYWESAPYQIINLLFHITRLPELQLY